MDISTITEERIKHLHTALLITLVATIVGMMVAVDTRNDSLSFFEFQQLFVAKHVLEQGESAVLNAKNDILSPEGIPYQVERSEKQFIISPPGGWALQFTVKCDLNGCKAHITGDEFNKEQVVNSIKKRLFRDGLDPNKEREGYFAIRKQWKNMGASIPILGQRTFIEAALFSFPVFFLIALIVVAGHFSYLNRFLKEVEYPRMWLLFDPSVLSKKEAENASFNRAVNYWLLKAIAYSFYMGLPFFVLAVNVLFFWASSWDITRWIIGIIFILTLFVAIRIARDSSSLVDKIEKWIFTGWRDNI